LAKLISQNADEIEKLFEQILLVCHKQGLLGNEQIIGISLYKKYGNANDWTWTKQIL